MKSRDHLCVCRLFWSLVSRKGGGGGIALCERLPGRLWTRRQSCPVPGSSAHRRRAVTGPRGQDLFHCKAETHPRTLASRSGSLAWTRSEAARESWPLCLSSFLDSLKPCSGPTAQSPAGGTLCGLQDVLARSLQDWLRVQVLGRAGRDRLPPSLFPQQQKEGAGHSDRHLLCCALNLQWGSRGSQEWPFLHSQTERRNTGTWVPERHRAGVFSAAFTGCSNHQLCLDVG